LGDHNSALRVCCAPKILHVLENGQGLLAHTPPGSEVPPTFYFKRDSQTGLKFSKCVLITLEVGGVAPQNCTTWHAAM